MDYHIVVQKIKDLLTAHNAWLEVFEHEPVTTSEDAAKIRTGYSLSQGTKALIVKAKVPEKGKIFIMVVVPGDQKFDSEKLKGVFGIREVRFATEDEVIEITGGVKRGGVPPFGNLFDLAVYADQKVFENEKVIFNAGDRSVSIGMFSKDYKEIVNPLVGDISCVA